MLSLNKKIGVKFDESDKKTYNLGNGIELVRATSWLDREDDGEVGTKKMTNVNHLEINPQIATVVIENADFDLKVGDKLFLHYLAYEWSDESVELSGELCDLISIDNVLFKIEDKEYIMRPKCYLGESIIDKAPQTASGIFLSSVEDQKNPLQVKITHTPMDVHEMTGSVLDVAKIGDTVITIDSNNYPIVVDGKGYIFLRENEIVGLIS